MHESALGSDRATGACDPARPRAWQLGIAVENRSPNQVSTLKNTITLITATAAAKTAAASYAVNPAS